MRSVSAGHWKLTMTNWEQSLKSILLQLHEKLLNSMLTIQWLFSLWSKLERWKSLISGCLASWSQIKKSHHLEMSYLTACNNNQPVLNWIVMCNEKWFYMTTSNHQLSVCTEKFQSNSQSQTGTQTKGHGPWWSAAGLIHYIFLNPDKTISSEKCAQQINGMHWKLQHL